MMSGRARFQRGPDRAVTIRGIVAVNAAVLITLPNKMLP